MLLTALPVLGCASRRELEEELVDVGLGEQG